MHFSFEEIGTENGPLVIAAHGWGQNKEAFRAYAETLGKLARFRLIDLPGFGESDTPPDHWGTDDYADFIAQHLNETNASSVIWIGHSYGGRVGVALAARHPDKVKALILIAASGIPRQRSLMENITFKSRIILYKCLKKMVPLGVVSEDWLKQNFGSSDYKNAGAMRPIFVRVVGEDLRETAKNVRCPTLILYGEKDGEAPPDVGKAYAVMIKDSRYIEFAGQNHYSVLGEGRHPIIMKVKDFIQRNL